MTNKGHDHIAFENTQYDYWKEECKGDQSEISNSDLTVAKGLLFQQQWLLLQDLSVLQTKTL